LTGKLNVFILVFEMEIFMKLFFRALGLTSIVSTISGSAMAAPRGAPSPEIGEGLVGAVIATVALLVFVLYPRLKRSRQSKEY
jgi:hypothetical protein